MLPVEHWETSCANPGHFLLKDDIRGNQGIIIIFYYLIQNINVVVVVICLQDKHNNNGVS